MYNDALSLVVIQEELFLDGVDAEDALGVDDVLAAHPDITVGNSLLNELLLDALQSEGHHELYARGIEHMGIVVIGKEIEHLAQVDDKQLVVAVEAESLDNHSVSTDGFGDVNTYKKEWRLYSSAHSYPSRPSHCPLNVE